VWKCVEMRGKKAHATQDQPMEVLLSLASNFTTAPVALSISEAMGGILALTAVLAIITRIIRAVTVPPLMNLLRITDWRARGFAVHVIGTARAFQVNPVAGAYTGIAMALNALLKRWLVWKRFNLVLVRSAAWREGLGKWVPS